MTDYQNAAQTALDVQNGCNLSGVLTSFHRIVQDVLWPEARRQGKGTRWVNEHPIVVLFVDKLSSLSRHQFNETNIYSRACEHVEALARGEAPDITVPLIPE